MADIEPVIWLIPELIMFAEVDGETVGFIANIPDVNPAMKVLNGRLYPWRLMKFFKLLKNKDCFRTVIMGVLPEHRGRNIDRVFYLKTILTGVGMGFAACDCSLIAETNVKMIAELEYLDAEISKTYRIYEKNI